MQPSEVIKVGPDLARKWLDQTSDVQRAVSQDWVAQLTRRMKDGEWRLTAEPITFDTSGELIEGQHRLLAVVQSGVEVEFLVVHGAPRDSFAVINQGRRRSAGQFYGGKHAVHVMAAARMLWNVEHHLSYINTKVKTSWPQQTIDTQLGYAASWPELAEHVSRVDRISRSTAVVQVPGRLLLPVIAQAARTQHADRIDDFLDGMHTLGGITEPDTDPRAVLRKRLSTGPHIRSFISSNLGVDTGYTLVVKTWNTFVDGAVLKQLKVQPGERRATVRDSAAAAEWMKEPIVQNSQSKINITV